LIADNFNIAYASHKIVKLKVPAISQQPETTAIISPSIMKSKSRQILDMCCEPEEIGHLKVGLFRG
jgi:hypothetical protein